MTVAGSIDAYLQELLEKRQEAGLLRKLICPENLVDFCSNDYLGFASHPLLKKIPDNLSAGATGSRLISGNSKLAEDTEKLVATYHHAEAGLIFNTGYMANVGLFSCLATRQDTYLYDEHIHASIIDGMRLSLGKRFKFKHNDLADLEKKLRKTSGRTWVAVESVYSMDGDTAPLAEMASLCQQYNAALIVDEAHATGVFGKKGEGLVVQEGLEDRIWARVHTLGKALGLHGAIVLGSKTLRGFLVNHARSFIYTTGLPPHLYLQIQQAYQLLPDAERKHLLLLIRHFQENIEKIRGIQYLNSDSPIQGIIIPDNTKVVSLANCLQEAGFFVKAILSPTVPKGSERIRVCLHSFNTFAQVDQLVQTVKAFFA